MYRCGATIITTRYLFLSNVEIYIEPYMFLWTVVTLNHSTMFRYMQCFCSSMYYGFHIVMTTLCWSAHLIFSSRDHIFIDGYFCMSDSLVPLVLHALMVFRLLLNVQTFAEQPAWYYCPAFLVIIIWAENKRSLSRLYSMPNYSFRSCLSFNLHYTDCTFEVSL